MSLRRGYLASLLLVALVAVGCSTGPDVVITNAVVQPVEGEDVAADPSGSDTQDGAEAGSDEDVGLPDDFEFKLPPDLGDDGTDEDEPDDEASGDGSSVFDSSFLANVATATESSDSYRFEMTFSMRIADPTFELDISPDEPLMVGAVAGSATWMLMDLGVFFEDAFASIPESEAEELTALLGADLTMETILDGNGLMYLRAPMLASLADLGGLPGGEDLAALASGWGTVDLSAATGLTSDGIADLTGAQMGSSPADLLDMLRAAGSEIVDLGGVDVRGVPTSHLRASVNIVSMIEAQGMDIEEFNALAGDVAGFLDFDLPFHLYVDIEGRVRRLTLELDLDALGGILGDDAPEGSEFSFATSMDFFDFGENITITAPPQDQIVGDFTEILLDLA